MNLVFVGGDSYFCSHLLRRIFAGSTQILTPPPLQLISAQARAYSNFQTAESFLREYRLTDRDRDELFAQLILMAPNSLLHQSSARALIESTSENFRFFPMISHLIPAGKLVFLVRDGRDVVASLLSSKRMNWGERQNDRPFQIQSLCNYWLECLHTALQGIGQNSLPASNRSILFYEDFWDETRFLSSVQSLLPPEVEVLEEELNRDFEKIDSSEVFRPGTWRSLLSEEECALVKAEIDEALASLGYLKRCPW